MVVLKRVFSHDSKSIVKLGVMQCLEMVLENSPVLLEVNWTVSTHCEWRVYLRLSLVIKHTLVHVFSSDMNVDLLTHPGVVSLSPCICRRG